ncbi:hypothetical protein ACFY36_51125 [Actinoplanes sp. NPDC000266]
MPDHDGVGRRLNNHGRPATPTEASSAGPSEWRRARVHLWAQVAAAGFACLLVGGIAVGWWWQAATGSHWQPPQISRVHATFACYTTADAIILLAVAAGLLLSLRSARGFRLVRAARVAAVVGLPTSVAGIVLLWLVAPDFLVLCWIPVVFAVGTFSVAATAHTAAARWATAAAITATNAAPPTAQ